MQNTKQEILRVSLDLFSRHGYPGTSVRQIAGEVGISESAIYNHFKSKNEILKAIFEDFKPSKLNADIMTEELIEKLADPINFMRSYAFKLLDYWNIPEQRKFFRLMMMEQFRENEAKSYHLSDYLNEARSIWWMIFDEMMKHKFIETADPIVLANMFISPIYFIRMEFMAESGEERLDLIKEMVSRHIEFFWLSVSYKSEE